MSISLEWPVYIQQTATGHKQKTPGNINIIQLGSNVVNYTVIIELYNFKDNDTHLEVIGQKLKAIFNLQIDALVGHSHKTDYNKLKKQYPQFHLEELSEDIYHDIQKMALARGITTRAKGESTLQSLCFKEKLFLPKPERIRVGTIFASTNGTLTDEAKKYCQKDVEAPLIIHQLYQGRPDLTMRVGKDKSVRLSEGSKVDIMPERSDAIHPIAQGVVKQLGGRGSYWVSNNMKIRKDQVLVKVTKVFNKKGILHYPCDEKKQKKCACKQYSHGTITKECDFYTYSHLGKPPYLVVEMKSRLRLTNDLVEYPPCVYEEDDGDTDPTETVVDLSSNAVNGDEDKLLKSHDEEQQNKVSDDDVFDEGLTPLSKEVLKLLREDDNGDPNCDGGIMEEVEEHLTKEEISMATNQEFNKTLELLIEEADRLAQVEDVQQQAQTNNSPQKHRTVLGDLFHFMDRAKLPMHHEYKALYFRSLRAAMFIMNSDDVEEVKAVLASKSDTSWEKKMAFDYAYIAQRVRRYVPEPNILYNRVKAVYEFFKDKKDKKTGVILFNDANRNRFENMLTMLKKGYASDPPGMAMYLPKRDSYGRTMVDGDGLTLYRSIRGTSNLESLHQYLTTSFGHTAAGPYYSDCLLTLVRHFFSWRMSRKNRPGFPQLRHYNGLLIDRINSYYEQIYGYAKYVSWESFNENLPPRNIYGIVNVKQERTSNVAVTDADKEIINRRPMLRYLAERQGGSLPFVPIRGETERRLAHRLLNEVISSDQSLSNQTIFEKLANDWNTHHVSITNKIYPKLPTHFSRYVKAWQKNQDRRDAELASRANLLSNVLERVPARQPMQIFESVPLASTDNTNETPNIQHVQNTSTTDSSDPTDASTANIDRVTETVDTGGLELICQAVETEAPPPPPVEMQPPPSKKRKRTCQGTLSRNKKTGTPCPNPDTCPGMNGRANCVLKTGGDSSKKEKRQVTVKYTKKCAVCRIQGCPGVRGRSRCVNK